MTVCQLFLFSFAPLKFRRLTSDRVSTANDFLLSASYFSAIRNTCVCQHMFLALPSYLLEGDICAYVVQKRRVTFTVLIYEVLSQTEFFPTLKVTEKDWYQLLQSWEFFSPATPPGRFFYHQFSRLANKGTGN